MIYRPRSAQIDLIKGAAILSVIALHTLSGSELRAGWSALHIGQAVPVFFVLMGMNAAASLNRRPGSTLRSLYSHGYASGRVERLFVPFAVVWLVSLLLGAAFGGLHFGPLMLTGIFPLAGPGNYFVTIAFEFALVFPALFWMFERAPRATVAGCLLLDMAFELAAPHVHYLAGPAPYGYDASIFRYLGQIALGVWIASAAGRGNRWIVCLAPLSVAYLVVQHQRPGWFSWLRDDFGTTTNVLSAFYAAALVLAGLRFLPSRVVRAPAAGLVEVGRASWHIFLVQIVWFFLVTPRGFLTLPLHIAATCTIGYALYYALSRTPVTSRLQRALAWLTTPASAVESRAK